LKFEPPGQNGSDNKAEIIVNNFKRINATSESKKCQSVFSPKTTGLESMGEPPQSGGHKGQVKRGGKFLKLFTPADYANGTNGGKSAGLAETGEDGQQQPVGLRFTKV